MTTYNMAIHKLSAEFCKRVESPGRYQDGLGLTLLVKKSGRKSWTQRITINGSRRDMGLGSLRFVTLKQARELARENAKMAAQGRDPRMARRQAMPTFSEAMEAVIRLRGAGWSPTHATKWRRQLELHAIPVLGDMRIDAIATGDVVRAVEKHWHETPKMAKELRQRIAVVIKWGVGHGYRADNPADAALAVLPNHDMKAGHHPSVDYRRISSVVETIRNDGRTYIGNRLALNFLVLTAARSNEVRGARWSELDLAARTWTVPAERMKSRRKHVVPLSDAAIAVLGECEAIRRGGELVFPGQNGNLAGVAVYGNHMHRIGLNATPHGFRSSFRVWAVECTNMPKELAEFALAHVVGNDAERAYARTDMLDKRRVLMDRWAAYVTRESGDAAGLN